MQKSITSFLQRKESGLAYAKDRDETLSNYQPHSTTQSGFKRKLRYRYDENEDFENINKAKETQMRSTTKKPLLNRVIYRSNRSNDPLSADLLKKPSELQPFLQTSRYDSKGFKSSNNSSAFLKQNASKTNDQDQFSNYQSYNRDKVELEDQQKEQGNNNSRKLVSRSSSQYHRGFYPKNGSSTPQNKEGQQGKVMTENTDYSEARNEIESVKDHISNTQSENLLAQEKDTRTQQHIMDMAKSRNENNEFETETHDPLEDQLTFDEISNQDWFKLLPEEVLNNKNIDLEKFFIENSEYFYNLLCQNAQLKGARPVFFNNDSNSIKLKYNPAFSTTYNKDFFKKSNKSTAIPQITDKIMQTKFLGQSQIDYTSQNQSDFKDHGAKEVEKHGPSYSYMQKPFMGLTSYNSNFVNWKDYNKIHAQAPKQLTIEMPFLGKTSYQESFCGNPHLKAETTKIEKQNFFKSPIPTYPLFFGETNYSQNFKSFKPISTPTAATAASFALSTDRFPNKSEVKTNNFMSDSKMTNTFYSSTPCYEGQFKTTFQKDYGNMKDEKFLASRLKKIWRKKILKKLEELRDEKEQRIINRK